MSLVYPYIKANDTPAKAIQENKLVEEHFLLAEDITFSRVEKLPCGFYEAGNLLATIEGGKEERQRIIIRCNQFEDLDKIEIFKAKILGNIITPKISYNGKKKWLKKLLNK